MILRGPHLPKFCAAEIYHFLQVLIIECGPRFIHPQRVTRDAHFTEELRSIKALSDTTEETRFEYDLRAACRL